MRSRNNFFFTDANIWLINLHLATYRDKKKKQKKTKKQQQQFLIYSMSDSCYKCYQFWIKWTTPYDVFYIYICVHNIKLLYNRKYILIFVVSGWWTNLYELYFSHYSIRIVGIFFRFGWIVFFILSFFVYFSGRKLQ